MMDFGNQYSYFSKEIDPRFPEPFFEEFDVHIFCDADHGHDQVTGRSITGVFAVVGSTPVVWSSKRQNSVHTSAFGAEFTALRSVVEEVISIWYCMRFMGIK
eukprot:3238105-Ditylum_brightwellii.AAC.1